MGKTPRFKSINEVEAVYKNHNVNCYLELQKRCDDVPLYRVKLEDEIISEFLYYDKDNDGKQLKIAFIELCQTVGVKSYDHNILDIKKLGPPTFNAEELELKIAELGIEFYGLSEKTDEQIRIEKINDVNEMLQRVSAIDKNSEYWEDDFQNELEVITNEWYEFDDYFKPEVTVDYKTNALQILKGIIEWEMNFSASDAIVEQDEPTR